MNKQKVVNQLKDLGFVVSKYRPAFPDMFTAFEPVGIGVVLFLFVGTKFMFGFNNRNKRFYTYSGGIPVWCSPDIKSVSDLISLYYTGA